MKIATKSVLALALCCLIAWASFFVSADSSLADSAKCYWMENYTGQYTWVDAPQGDISKQECYALDSCDGGLGQSDGGCYKWATAPKADRIPWKQCFWMENYSGKYNWVDAPQGDISKQECYALDSCDGGLGQSGGGCYKWAMTADGPRDTWNK